MGKKILTDAGYEVVAVSNGAAAVKKMAEQSPDMIILDVYMPGYSGLEVCEKVRATVSTLNTPVLLTVGKMEPYRPEEANRVKADGVIVKPFEASDLLAIVKKFEERISLASGPPRVEQDLAERYGESAVAAPSMENPEPVVKNTNQPTVEVPDHMATTSAFSDLLGADPSDSGAFNASGPPSAHEPAPRASVPVPDYDLPFSWRDAADSEAYASTAATPAVPVIKEVKEAIAEPSPAPLPARLLHIPVYREPEPEKPAKAPEIVATAAPPTGDVDIPREPALQETAAETTRNTVAESTEPGLMPTMQQDVTQQDPAPVPAADTDVSEPAPAESQYASAYTQDAPANIAPETPVETPAQAPRDQEESTGRLGAGLATVSDSDFESRVAAAIAAYTQATSSEPSEEPATEIPAAALEHASTMASPDADGQLAATETAPADPFDSGVQISSEAAAPSFEYYPPVGAPHPAQASETGSAG